MTAEQLKDIRNRAEFCVKMNLAGTSRQFADDVLALLADATARQPQEKKGVAARVDGESCEKTDKC